ncbi:MAG: DNA repair protein RecO [Synechococcaceae cyanobacterium]
MAEDLLEGIALRCGPLGEQDRLLTLLSEAEGLTRLALPGARRPRSSLAAAMPLARLRLQVGGRRGLRRVRQLQLLRSPGTLGQRLETLSAAQGLAELCLALVPDGAAAPGMVSALELALNRLEAVVSDRSDAAEALAIAVQSSVQLLALGGYALPLQCCARTGAALQPPVGDWSWRCSFFAAEGLAIGAIAGAQQLFNASELALLQRLPRPAPPRRRDGELLGPVPVWLRLLALMEAWSREHAGRSPRAFRLLRNALEPMTATGSTLEPPSP